MEPNNKYDRPDLLWKGIIEDFIEELLDFFYPELEKERDKSKKVEFLDKFLKQIHPEAGEENRRADILIKVPLKEGKEKWILFHIEVQGYKDDNFPRRMFTYFYRSLDRFNVDVESLVIFTDSNKNYRPNCFEYEGYKTKLLYEFNIFKLIDYTNVDFGNMKNPLGIIFQTALIGMKRNLKDEQLLELKVILYRKLLKKGYSREQIKKIGTFIRDLIRFKDKKFNRIFVEQVDILENNNEPMGIIETVINLNRQEAAEEGMQKGMQKGVIINDLQKSLNFLDKSKTINLSNKNLADMADLDILFIEDFKKGYSSTKLVKLKAAIKKSEKIIDLELVKNYLIKSMHLYGFSVLVLAKYFKFKKVVVEKIVNKIN